MNTIFPELPTKLGLYSLTQVLGVREHSELYLAKQSYVDRTVVIEVLRPDSPPEIVEFFQETARRRAAASLPHVSPVLESVKTGVLHYLIQELPKGKPLTEKLAEGGHLSLDQGFAFVQAVADIYCACIEQKMAALPLSMDSVYMDGDHFAFFSPVIQGEITDDLRREQMESLASILEGSLPMHEAAQSNLAIIIHWLRYGYGSMPLEWEPLASSLSTLRSQKYAPTKGNIAWNDLMKPSSVKRRVRRAVRTVKENAAFVGVTAAVTLVAGVAAAVYAASGTVNEQSAVADGYIYCRSSAGAYRVQAQPVSIAEYGRFLSAWDKMSNAQKKDINQGMPENIKNHTPWQWDEQNTAASLGLEWYGRKMDENTPVSGVSYWDALAYARYVGGRLPGMEQIKLSRQSAGEPLVEEWTASGGQAGFPLESCYMVYPAYGNTFIQEINPTQQEKLRGFRVVFDNN